MSDHALPVPVTGSPDMVAAEETAAARAAMVARLEAAGDLRPGPLRDALLALPREVLMPQAYVRRSAPDETPPRWDLLDWSAAEDRRELLDVLYGGGSVPIQHDGEPILGRVRGSRRGGSITSMSSVMGMTAGLLHRLDLRPGQRVLDIGTGSGLTAAMACLVCGDARVVTVDRDPHITAAAKARLSALGCAPTVVTGDGEAGWAGAAPYDRILVSFAVPRVPAAWVEQLAPGGLALATVSTRSPSWPGLAVVTRTPDGLPEAELRAVEFGHRAGHGLDHLSLSPAFRERIAAGNGSTSHSRLAPPPDAARGMWLALDHLHPGLVRHFGAEHLVVGAPECGSWLTVRPGGEGVWTVTASGPRDIWDEIQDTAARWRAAGEPGAYRLEFGPGGEQWASAGHGRGTLSWRLPGPGVQDGTVPR
ncbi:methyltransferase domain-containing protein [Streptomyces glaucosporus]|uniref:Protein-L-isoaspartate O-methyltransferase n=1 Tax=Streptomyces glaucosporus TaxID=284044 RepID=A0ABP5VRF8_9ACTN